jgi:hypothetical protein
MALCAFGATGFLGTRRLSDHACGGEARPAKDAPVGQVSNLPVKSKVVPPAAPEGQDSNVPAENNGKENNEPKAPPREEANTPLGHPLASGIMELLEDEMRNGLTSRGATDEFARWRSYMAMKISSTSAPHTGSEVTGNCRLRWYEQLLQNPLKAPAEGEQFTRELHAAVLADGGGLAGLLPMIAEKLDLAKREPRRSVEVKSPQQALEVVKQALIEAQMAYAAALSPLTKSEIRELMNSLYPVMTGQNSVGHTLNDRGTGRRMCDLMEKMDRNALITAAEALVPLTDPKLLEQLKSLPEDGDVSVPGVRGRVVAKILTPAGNIVIGGKGANVYSLDDMRDVAAVIDLGGDDGYGEGTVGPDRPVLLVIDLAGDDAYRGSKPGVQGGAILGVSMLLDLEGNDAYEARDVAQASTTAGVGILIDYAGNDRYSGVRRVQGQALGGLGILIDRGGSDDYHAAMWAQGYGGPLGFALLDDVAGNDHYYSGGLYVNSYKPETPGYEGWGQGVGSGIRQCASGGIGVILEGAGDDVYEFDYLSHGGGYWCGLGFARDFGGNDKRLICRNAFNGGQRTEQSFQRFGSGWGCHYAAGFCFDDAGDDVYEGTIMGTGMGWDCAIGVLCDFAGSDRYEATGGLTQGTGAQASLGVLYDYSGDDTYLGYGQGYASTGISYHDLPGCGGNFGFLADYGGHDKYGSGAANNTFIQRGARGGFLIDRPARGEAAITADKPGSNVSRPDVAGEKLNAAAAAKGDKAGTRATGLFRQR